MIENKGANGDRLAVAPKGHRSRRCPSGATAKRIIVVVAIAWMACSARAESPSNGSVDQALDALHDRGQSLHAFTADLKLTETDTTFQTTTIRSGHVWFQKMPDGGVAFRVVFETRQAGGKKTEPDRKEYLLDGNWLIDRDYHGKREVRRQIAQPGKKINLFQLGKGPFPLPIGQDRQSVQTAFDVAAVAAAGGDPAGATHLRLIPKPETDLARKFSQVDIWVNRVLHMPVRIETLDTNGTTDRTTDLQNLNVNPTPGLTPADFELPPLGDHWESHEEKFND